MNEASADPRRWGALVLVLAGLLMACLDGFITNVAIPSIQSELHTNFAEVQLVVVGYTLAYAVGLVTGGRLGDIFGRKRLFLSGMFSFTLTSLICGLAPNATTLIIARVVQGLGAAMMVPQVLSIIQVSFSAKERPTAFSFYGAVIGFSCILGQLLGGLLISSNFMGLGWRNVFLVNVPIGIVAFFASFVLIRESRAEQKNKLDMVGVLLISLSMVLLTYPLMEGQDLGWPLWTFVCLALSVPSFILFMLYEQWLQNHGGSPLLPISLFSSKRFSLGLLTALMYYGAGGGWYFILSVFLQSGHNFSPLASGMAVAPIGVGFLASSLLIPSVIKRRGMRVLFIAPVFIAVGYAGSVLSAQHIGINLHTGWPLVPFMVCLGVGQGIISAPLVNLILTGIDHRQVGSASGALTTTQQISGALCIAVIGVIFFNSLGSVGSDAVQNSIQYGNAFLVSLIALIVMTVATLVFLVVLIHLPQNVAQSSSVESVALNTEASEELEIPLGGAL